MESIYLSTNKRITKLGNLGDALAAECLEQCGFKNVENLNDRFHNFPFADLLAEKGNSRYLIGVKTRNERRSDGKLNESYNAILIPDQKN